jgi:hypothetical protein
MECSKCKEVKEMMPRRKICRICYNKEKVIQRQKRIPNEHEDECTKCLKLKIIPKGKRWCKECKNDYEQLRKSNFSETKKEEEKQKSKEYYKKVKENVKEIIIDKTITKICSNCNKEKTLDKFFLSKCRGTIRPACKECTLNKRKEYYQNNKEKTIKQTTKYQVARCKIDPVFKLERNLRSRLYHALINQKADKLYRTKKLTGCEFSFLKGYLECRFKEGMTWENHGTWHIDHIRPCCSFDLTTKEGQNKCFHYTNLQPLWAHENLSKGGKYDAVDEVDTVDEVVCNTHLDM